MRKILLPLFVTLFSIVSWSQEISLTDFIKPLVSNSVVLFRIDYQMIDPETGRVYTRDNDTEYYGRKYIVGARIADNQFLVPSNAAFPWQIDHISSGKTREPFVSNGAFRDLKSTEWIPMNSLDNESFNTVIEGRVFTLPDSEIEGLTLDTTFGTKRGYVMWVTSANPISESNDLSQLNISLSPLNIKEKEDFFVYDFEEQPTGEVLGGIFIVPYYGDALGSVSFRINGLFQKVGGIWKLFSIGSDMPEME